MGPQFHGLAAYLNANELDPPPRFQYGVGIGNEHDFDYIAPLVACWFDEAEIAAFPATERYVTGRALLARWHVRLSDHSEAFVVAKIRESRLDDLHPITGGTQATSPGDDAYPPITSGLFSFSQIEAIEQQDFGGPLESTDAVASDGVSSDEHNAQGNSVADEKCNDADQSAVFRAMHNLDASELSLVFVGDKPSEGIGANNMLSVTARGETRRVPLASIELVNRRTGTLNGECGVLLAFSQGREVRHTGANSAKMWRLREALRSYFGFKSDPFEEYHRTYGWVPRFRVSDNRGAADERALRDAEAKTVSYEGMLERGQQFPDFVDASDPSGGNDAEEWLRENDPQRR